jgi:patatin-related protein
LIALTEGVVVAQGDEYVQGAIGLELGPPADGASPSVITQYVEHDAKGPFGRTLRIALAMKGGVSLAVWIGGAVTELDVLRQIRLTGDKAHPGAQLLATWRLGEDVLKTKRELITRATVYAKLLASRGYDAVEFDVLAGASAGGLNAVMYGVAQRAGTGTDFILDTFRSSGGLWKLLRGGGVHSIDSVLRGDDFFWGAMLGALRQIHEAPPHPGLVAPVSIDLSATVIDAEASSERGTREGKAHFHFSGGTTTDLPGRIIPLTGLSEADTADALTRLAYAARSTSSFPGAFEPARVYSGVGPARDDAVDMKDAFHAHRAPRASEPEDVEGSGSVLTDPFRVVDGGVTDNVPIDRALRAIRNRPANHYVNRGLVYLDPSPKLEFDGLIRPTPYHGRPPVLPPEGSEATRAPGKADARSAFLSVVFTSLGHMLGRESKDDEVEDVERFRRLLFLEQAKDELFAPLTDEPIKRPGSGLPEHVARAYARFRSGSDLDFLSEVLVQPSLWQLTTLTPSAAHRGWRREELRRLESEVITRVGGPAADGVQLAGICTGYQAVVDACRCLIAWTRAIEDGTFWRVGGIRELDDVIWAGSGAKRNRRDHRNHLHDQLSEALRDRDAAMSAVLSAADALAPGDDSVDPATLAGVIVDEWLARANATPEGPSRWDQLQLLVEDLRAVSIALDGYDNNSPTAVEARNGRRQYDTDWSQSPWSGIGRTESTFVARDLAPLVAPRARPGAIRPCIAH